MHRAAHIASQGACAIAAGAAFGVGLLALDVAGLGSLVLADGRPATAVIFVLGALIAFTPVVLCTAPSLLAPRED